MFPIDTTGLVGLLGLLTQCAVAWIFVVFFAVLARSAGRPAWFTEWTLSFAALAGALTAMSLRYAWPLFSADGWFGSDGVPEVRAAYALYAAGKALHVALLCTGTLQFARGALSPRARRRVFAASALLAGALAVPSADVRALMIVQAPVMCLGLAAAGILLARLPAARRDVGTRTAALALAASAVLWALYTVAFLRADGVTWPVRRDLWTALLAYNSYLDLGAMIALAAGLSAALQQDAQRRLRALQAEREALAAELARDEKLRALGTLVSGVAHELNNPLAAILAAAEDLRSAERAPARRARLDELIEQVRRSGTIVETLTGLRRSTNSGSEPVDAVELARRACAAQAGAARERGVTCELSGAATADCVVDARAVERALAALLDNAVRVSPRGARVEVQVALDGDAVCFAVEDGGPGVPSELRERIFEPFFTTQPEEGRLGLGLSLAHATARAHGGRLSVEAGARGARFVLVLPRERPGPELVPRAENSTAAGRALHVLVVDDEPMLREVLVSFGLREGWRVECAADGESALRLLREADPAPDCVLCDLRMPGLGGARLHARVRELDPTLAERFLFQSGDVTSPEAVAVARETGLPVLEKPLSFARLRQLVEQACERRTAGSAR